MDSKHRCCETIDQVLQAISPPEDGQKDTKEEKEQKETAALTEISNLEACVLEHQSRLVCKDHDNIKHLLAICLCQTTLNKRKPANFEQNKIQKSAL